VAATLELGECLQHLKQYVKALHCYERAAEKSLHDPEAAESHKLALYRAGVLAGGMKELETAERNLRALAELDPEYKDVQTRLDKVRQFRDKG
jgi:tetratricopeptide (TPR) repeat protein